MLDVGVILGLIPIGCHSSRNKFKVAQSIRCGPGASHGLPSGGGVEWGEWSIKFFISVFRWSPRWRLGSGRLNSSSLCLGGVNGRGRGVVNQVLYPRVLLPPLQRRRLHRPLLGRPHPVAATRQAWRRPHPLLLNPQVHGVFFTFSLWMIQQLVNLRPLQLKLMRKKKKIAN